MERLEQKIWKEGKSTRKGSWYNEKTYTFSLKISRKWYYRQSKQSIGWLLYSLHNFRKVHNRNSGERVHVEEVSITVQIHHLGHKIFGDHHIENQSLF